MLHALAYFIYIYIYSTKPKTLTQLKYANTMTKCNFSGVLYLLQINKILNFSSTSNEVKSQPKPEFDLLILL